ncbi:endomucin isoform X1 [Saccopteryx bilineata]|uniref:endomucin isoform X1 n=1 Tax=Saccopteryx bilineata TaxID=59482 RepID=UPI00338DA91C
MKLLQVTVLCLLLSCLCSSEDSEDVENKATPALKSSTIPAAKTSVPTQITTSPNLVMKSTVGTSSEGTTRKNPLQTSPQTTLSSLTTTVKGKVTTTKGDMKNELTTTNTTVANLLLPNAVSTLQSSQHKTENQSSNSTTERPVGTPQPDASLSKTSVLSLISTIIPESISSSQVGTVNVKNASPSSSTNPSHSSIILPVVIALIVITLSVFALVGLYRMCRKTDPGTPENGNDQPQSDKESVKLLTVKTISHESGEHSAQGKTKN